MLIYIDQIEAFGLGAKVNIYDYTTTLLKGFTCWSVGAVNTSSVGSADLSVVAGDVTDRALGLYANNRGAFSTTEIADCQIAALKSTVNPFADHWASFDFKWDDNPYGARTKPFAFFGFNDAVSVSQWTTHAAARVVTLKRDGSVGVGGNFSSAGVVPMSTPVHVDIEVLVGAGQVNVYVNNSLAVSSPSGMTWLATGLTAIGMRCDPWPVSADAQEYAPRLNEYFDNLTIYDSTGLEFNARLTDAVIYKRLPLATQTESGFVNVGGASSTIAALSDHSGIDFDNGTYARSPDEDGLADMFTVDTSGLDPADTVRGVSIVNVAKRNALGRRHIESRIANGPNVLDINHTPQTPIGFAAANPAFAGKNPDGSMWTPANLAATKFGYVAKTS